MSSGSPTPSSPQRHRIGGDHSNSGKEERPRFFDTMAKKLCWAKADIVPGRHPERWRKDAAGNVVCKRFGNCQGCLCFEYDHIVPFSKGGESVVENCQILQTRVNRVKSDKDHLDKTQLRGYSCDINFTDKELDVIEMAVYGDVIRPGNECRCRSIDELLGRYKPKDHTPAYIDYTILVVRWPTKVDELGEDVALKRRYVVVLVVKGITFGCEIPNTSCPQQSSSSSSSSSSSVKLKPSTIFNTTIL